MYRPSLGRWMQTDPEGYKDSLNLYEAYLSSPTKYTDAYGLTAEMMDHHPYPMHLGGDPHQPLLRLPKSAHDDIHQFFREKGYGFGDAGRQAWNRLSRSAQRKLIEESLIVAKVPPAQIENALKVCMRGAVPGVRRIRVPKSSATKFLSFGFLLTFLDVLLSDPSPAWAAEPPPASKVDDHDKDGIPDWYDPDSGKKTSIPQSDLDQLFYWYHENMEKENSEWDRSSQKWHENMPPEAGAPGSEEREIFMDKALREAISKSEDCRAQ